MRLAGLILLLSDALLAVLIWLAAYELRSIWGWHIELWWDPPQTVMVIGAFTVSVWIGLRSLMGLYPGSGLSLAEWLRRHRYTKLTTHRLVWSQSPSAEEREACKED